MVEPPEPKRADGHDDLLLRESGVEVTADKMIQFIACNNNLLPGVPIICAIRDTDAVAINPRVENTAAQTSAAGPGGESLKIHVQESWATNITGFCRNCDNPETNGHDRNCEKVWSLCLFARPGRLLSRHHGKVFRQRTIGGKAGNQFSGIFHNRHGFVTHIS